MTSFAMLPTNRPRARVPVALAVCLIILLSGVEMAGARIDAAPASSANEGAFELQSAMASLAGAHGPAAGVPLTCTSAASASATCEVSSSSVRPATTGPAWSNISTKVVPSPSGRFTTMTWDAADGYVLLYGGAGYNSSGDTVVLTDTWSYLNGVWTNLTHEITGGPPPAAEDAALAYDPWTSEAILFGGFTLKNYNLSLTWTYHNKVWANITSTVGTPPSPRVVPIFVADLVSKQMILFGGLNESYGFSQSNTWLFTGTTWSNITGTVGTSPPPLAGASGAYDPAESGIVVWGTILEGPQAAGLTFLFAGGTWHNLTTSEEGVVPTTDLAAVGSYAPTSSLIAVASVEFNDTGSGNYAPVMWSFSDGNWTNITSSVLVPASGSVAAVATDPSGALLMFGGATAISEASDLSQWMYAYSAGPSSVQVTSTAPEVDAGSSTTFSATFSGGLSPYETNLSFGDGQFGLGASSGAHTYTTPKFYTVSFTVTDFTGASAQGTATITVNAPPSAAVIRATPTSPTTGATVNFGATVTGGTAPYTSAWTFGDGTSSTSGAPSHSYASPGTYTVNLTISDSDHRTANSTLTVVVSSPSSSGFSLTSGVGLYALLGIVVIVVVVVVAVLVTRQRKRPPAGTAPPTQWSAPPPVGASGGPAPPAPVSPPPPGGPPPGA